MTRKEQRAKQEIIRILQEEGYVTYARLFELFDLNLTKDPNVVGYMQPDKARIVINENLNIDQVSFIVRHEILHEYLDHQLRMKRHMGDDNYAKRSPAVHQLINMAADYEISNRGYTDKDKKTARNIQLGDKVVQGLVTDIDHPEWTKLSVEEMFDKLMEEYEKNKEQMEQMLKQLADSGIGIGDGQGSAQQEMEDIERKAQEQAEQAEAQGDEQGKEQNQKIAKAAGEAAEDAKEQNGDDSEAGSKGKKSDEETDGKGKVFQSEEEQKEAEELAKRVKQIKKEFQSAAKRKSIETDDVDKKDKEEVAKAARDAEKYNQQPLQKFKLSLNQFIRDAVATGRGPTWTRFNKKYTNSSLIKPGSSRLRQNKVPLINVYFDRSYSWDDAKTRDGERAMSFLNEYARKGQIKIDLYYFSNNVHGGKDGRRRAEMEGGTEGQPILDHINATKPDNVIVMTDNDIDDCRTDTTVPGAVYFLFKGGRSQNLVSHLHGKKLTKEFDI